MTVAQASQDELLDELRREGVVVVPNYLTGDECAALRHEIDACMRERPQAVRTDEEDCDHRLFAFERVSVAASRFHEDPWLRELARGHCRSEVVNAFTLAAKLVARPDNRGSGLGWHRDSFARQFKAIVYLSDVAEDNGPFQYLCGSARLGDKLLAMWRGRLGYRQNRLEDAQVERLLSRDPGRLRTVTGAAGALVLASTSGIHRGMPILSGTRYALTNYYYPVADYTPKLLKHFGRLPTVDGQPIGTQNRSGGRGTVT